MGSSSSSVEENKKLKKEIENELKPEIKRLTEIQALNEGKEKKLLAKNEKLKKNVNNLKKLIMQNNIDLSPEQIQELMVNNSIINEKYNNLEAKYNNLMIYSTNLLAENNQIKIYCAQLQLILQMKMMQSSYCQNLNNFNQFENNMLMYQNELNSIVNNRINTNGQNNFITILFNIDNKKKFPVVTLPYYRLGNIFLLIKNQIGNALNIKFFYNAKNITNHFMNNDEVRCLNLKTYNPVIEVTTCTIG